MLSSQCKRCFSPILGFQAESSGHTSTWFKQLHDAKLLDRSEGISLVALNLVRVE